MTEKEIVCLALENLEKDTGITGTWVERKDIDGEINFKINDKSLHYRAIAY